MSRDVKSDRFPYEIVKFPLKRLEQIIDRFLTLSGFYTGFYSTALGNKKSLIYG